MITMCVGYLIPPVSRFLFNKSQIIIAKFSFFLRQDDRGRYDRDDERQDSTRSTAQDRYGASSSRDAERGRGYQGRYSYNLFITSPPHTTPPHPPPTKMIKK